MSEKLLPCPFCGGEASVHRCEHAFHDAKIRCAGCQAEGPIFDVDDGAANEAGRNEAEAIAAWNRRAPAPEKEASCIESALVKHLRSLGCVCSKPLVGYRPNAGPRCRLCNVEPASPVVPAPEGDALLCRLCSMGLKECDCISEPRYASPVVPVGREEIASILAAAFEDHQRGAAAPDDGLFEFMAKRILAALRPTDTGVSEAVLKAAQSIHNAAIIYEDEALLEDAEIVLAALRPVVPAPEGEAVDRVMAVLNCWFDGIGRIDRNSEMVAQLAALASPVVPVEVSREEIARAVHRGRFPEDRKPTPFEAEDASGTTYCFRIADAIIAALRHTDTGREA